MKSTSESKSGKAPRAATSANPYQSGNEAPQSEVRKAPPEARRRDPAAGKPGSDRCPDHPPGKDGPDKCCGSDCSFTFNIRARGDIHIHNFCAPPETGPKPGGDRGSGDCLVCTPQQSCLPPVAGAKHKLSRAQKVALRAARSPIASVLAASTMHAIRRFSAGHAAANPLETLMFARLSTLPPALLSCMVDGLNQLPPPQRDKLFDGNAVPDASQPLDPAHLATVLVAELQQRAALVQFGDPAALEERPGKNRLYEPQGEDFFTQVRICRVNQLRTANYIPALQPQEYTPEEVQQDCQPVVVNGEPQVTCQVRTANCPGNTLTGVCGRVLDIAQGEGVELEGVNYFDINAKVRLTDKDTGTTVRDVDAFVYGDVDTPRDEVIAGQTALINDCRVHDKATFTVPNDLPPGIYMVQVVVPNSVNMPGFGTEIVSNAEFINILPPPTARFQVVIERILAREETSPSWWGSDEVGLYTIAAALNLVGDPLEIVKTPFKDVLDGVEFDSGTARTLERPIFVSDQPILAVALAVLGHEIDSESAYDQQIHDWSDVFVDLIKDQWKFLVGLITSGGSLGTLFKSIGWKGAIAAAIVAVVVVAIDFIYSLWAPADLIIEDNLALSIVDIDRLTNVASPVPPPLTFKSNSGITVNVNKTIPPEKIPFQYREVREYVSDEEDSRYELTYRYNRLA